MQDKLLKQALLGTTSCIVLLQHNRRDNNVVVGARTSHGHVVGAVVSDGDSSDRLQLAQSKVVQLFSKVFKTEQACEPKC